MSLCHVGVKSAEKNRYLSTFILRFNKSDTRQFDENARFFLVVKDVLTKLIEQNKALRMNQSFMKSYQLPAVSLNVYIRKQIARLLLYPVTSVKKQ